VNLVRAFLTIGAVCLREGDPKPQGESEPTTEALTAPGGMTPENYTPPTTDEAKRLEVGISDSDARDRSAANSDIFLFSYGEYVPACSEVDYKPLVERAERLAKSHYPFLREDSRSDKSPNIIRREWFCATSPDIAVVHIYLRV
jgi:hypothetical protein